MAAHLSYEYRPNSSLDQVLTPQPRKIIQCPWAITRGILGHLVTTTSCGESKPEPHKNAWWKEGPEAPRGGAQRHWIITPRLWYEDKQCLESGNLIGWLLCFGIWYPTRGRVKERERSKTFASERLFYYWRNQLNFCKQNIRYRMCSGKIGSGAGARARLCTLPRQPLQWLMKVLKPLVCPWSSLRSTVVGQDFGQLHAWVWESIDWNNQAIEKHDSKSDASGCYYVV